MFLKPAVNLTTAGCRVKCNEMWNSGTLVKHIWAILDFVDFKVICVLGVIWCTCPKLAVNSKTSDDGSKVM